MYNICVQFGGTQILKILFHLIISGCANLMLFSLYAADQTKIENQDISIEEYHEKDFGICKVLLMSKPFRFEFDDLSDDDDFQHDKLLHKNSISTPKLHEDEKLPIQDNLYDSITEDLGTNEIEERRELIEQQNRAYEMSLEADKLKDHLLQLKRKEIEEKRQQQQDLQLYLKNLKLKRQMLIPNKPSLSDPCNVITVHHLSLGRKIRIFPSHSKMEDVYNWVGGLH